MDSRLKAILKKLDIPESTPVEKYTSGFINDTYHVGEFVIKIQRELDVLAHQPELLERAHAAGAKVQRVIDYGVIDEKQYLVLGYLPGRQLTEGWLQFSESQKESFIKQIVEQLKIFHSINFEQYSPQRPGVCATFTEFMQKATDFAQYEDLGWSDEARGRLRFLIEFFNSHSRLLEPAEPPVLVYNDLHFNNILYEGDLLTGIIDFDFARQAPKEYELWHLVDFFSTPTNYVQEEVETIWAGYSLGRELQMFATYYPELFLHPGLHDRLRLYLMDELLSALKNRERGRFNSAKDKFNFQFHRYFETDWLEKNVPMN